MASTAVTGAAAGAVPVAATVQASACARNSSGLNGACSSSSGFAAFSGLRRCSPSQISSHARTLRASAVPTEREQTVCVAAPPSKGATPKRSKVEIVKENSDFLRHPLLEDLTTSEPNVSEASAQLIKFHGSYMQDDREKRAFGSGKSYQFMMRTRQPAGKVTNKLYLVMDDLADAYGNGTLRLTTRQAYQLHGVLKADLKTVFSTVIRNMGSTLAACGDVNRNIMAPPAPFKNKPEYKYAEEYSEKIADLLAPQSGAYYDVWLDGEKFASSVMEDPEVTKAREDFRNNIGFPESPEPIYGKHFLPRKFKIGITVPGDNSLDLLTQDLGLVVITDSAGNLEGFNLYVGGGMGRTHRDNQTFARLADPLGFVKKEDIYHAVKAVVATQRDYGRRDERKYSRLKYLVASWGVDKFRTKMEEYLGSPLEPSRPLPPWKYVDFMGWHEQGDGKLFYGVNIVNGRIKGEQKKALRRIIERYDLSIRLTPSQSLILCDIFPTWRRDITSTLAAVGLVDITEVDPLVRNSMACPALPLCGLAIGEAERTLPDINSRIRVLMNKIGLSKDDSFVIRMTGCPNGCARPYMAELALVGDGPNSYQIWLAGCPNQTRLARAFADKVKVQELETFLEPLLTYWHTERTGPAEAFGDFCERVGFEGLTEYQSTFVSPAKYLSRPRVALEEDAFAALQRAAEVKGTTLSELASEAVRAFVGKEGNGISQ